MPDLRPLFYPASVAIVGAAGDEHSLRGRLTRQLLGHRYAGKVYPITRSAGEVMGIKTFASVADLPEAPELAIILVPAAHVVSTLDQCGQRGIRAAVVISSGFGEEKTEEAAGRDAELRAICERWNMVVSGPNSEGLVNPLNNFVATFSPVFHDFDQPLLPKDATAKPIAVSCQSGALTFSFLSRGRDRGLQFTYQVSSGNQTVLEAHDYMDWIIDAGGADIFMAYLEGIRRPDRFREVADKAARAGKPLILAKVGRSDAGVRAASSHTGSLARSGAVDDAIFRHHGIVRGEDLDHMVDVATAFAYCKLPKGNRVAIITGSGGSAVWMADILSEHGLELPVLEDDIRAKIMAMLPPYASALNPIDATAQAIGEVGYAPIVELVRQSKRIDTIILIASLANESTAKKRAEELGNIAADTEQPILLSTYTTATPGAMAAFAKVGVPCYTAMPSCARAIRALVDYGKFQERMQRRAAAPETPAAARQVVAAGLAAAGASLTEHSAKALLAHYGIRRPPEELAASEDDSVAAANRISGPVALKVESPDILHKTEAGAVLLNLADEAAVRDGYRTVLARAKAAHPNAAVEGVLVQAMARRGQEMILGITRDPDFGPMLMVGLGGIHVEVLKDVAFAPVPLSTEDALDLVAGLRGAALLDGVRGAPPSDRGALAELMVALSRFAHDHRDTVAEIDLNPVIVHEQGAGLTVVDALIVKN
ncbi:MAG TPA: acetate--CoA ligase family protein [Stellaceae bacterium]|jgi:acyl-CoA synthetase (NDP forming)|nr:acetate--CoA ligase family protein [Stellaceae bacterium]